jgi:hypothetical protein
MVRGVSKIKIKIAAALAFIHFPVLRENRVSTIRLLSSVGSSAMIGFVLQKCQLISSRML